MTLNSEWDRVKDNPDNLIVSDSLRDLLDPETYGANASGASPKGIRFISKLAFLSLNTPAPDLLVADEDRSVILGSLLSFSRGAKEWCYIFEVKAELLHPILMCGSLAKIEVTDQNNSFKHEIEFTEDDAEPTIAFELHALNGDTPATSALLTVTVAAPA
jgi:hypothetical protein